MNIGDRIIVNTKRYDYNEYKQYNKKGEIIDSSPKYFRVRLDDGRTCLYKKNEIELVSKLSEVLS